MDRHTAPQQVSIPASLTRRGVNWRRWVIVLAVSMIGVTSISTVWHGEHGADQDCAVCQLRQQPAAELSVAPAMGHTPVPHQLVLAPAAHWVSTDPGPAVPARAPPV